MNPQIITLDYYSDILCIWAWVAQKRLTELEREFGNQIVVNHHAIDLFGDTQKRIETQWKDKGTYEGFAKHVQQAGSAYEYAFVHDDIWTRTRPSTSSNAHLFIKAVSLCYDKEVAALFELNVRKAFFESAVDISTFDELNKISHSLKLDQRLIEQKIHNGQAFASLMTDYQLAREQNIKGSPCFVLDSGRQTLYGNVGYRVLRANVEELLKNPNNEASWC